MGQIKNIKLHIVTDIKIRGKKKMKFLLILLFCGVVIDLCAGRDGHHGHAMVIMGMTTVIMGMITVITMDMGMIMGTTMDMAMIMDTTMMSMSMDTTMMKVGLLNSDTRNKPTK